VTTMAGRRLVLALVFILAAPTSALTHEAHADHSTQDAQQRLPLLGPAPDFSLIDQDRRSVTLRDFRGKVVALTFIYTTCPDICPMLTANMAQVQQELGADFGRTVAFVSITVDPERDTPEVLKSYADGFGISTRGWAFLTGDPAVLKTVGQRYGIFATRGSDGEIDHTLLTSLIDRDGRLRVQYLGARFDLEEFRRDLLGLMGQSE
jgi:protein SCO1